MQNQVRWTQIPKNRRQIHCLQHRQLKNRTHPHDSRLLKDWAKKRRTGTTSSTPCPKRSTDMPSSTTNSPTQTTCTSPKLSSWTGADRDPPWKWKSFSPPPRSPSRNTSTSCTKTSPSMPKETYFFDLFSAHWQRPHERTQVKQTLR